MNEAAIKAVRLVDIRTEQFKRRNFDFIVKSERGHHVKQEQCLQYLTDKETNYVIYGGAAGGAKSWTGATWLTFMCLAYPGTRWFVGRNELKRLRQSTLPTINKVTKKYSVVKGRDYTFHGTDNCFIFNNGSRIDFLDLRYKPSDPMYERFGSIEYTGGWIEESGEVDFLAYDVLKSRVGRHMNDEYDLPKKLFITLNPKKNWNFTRFYLPYKEGKLNHNEKFIQALVTDNPYRESGYVETLEEIEDVGLRERLRYGNWDYDDDPLALTDYDAQCDLFTNSQVRPDPDSRYITADIALQGSDELVIGVWYGLVCVVRVAIPKSDGKLVVLTIDSLKIKHKVPNSNIIYDADGIGGFIGGFVKGAVAFHNGAAPLYGENYENIKTQLYYKLAKYVMSREIWMAAEMDDRTIEKIKAEVAQIKSRTPDDDKKLKIIKKEEVKKNIGRSPDNTDMMMMRMYFEMKRPVLGRQREVKSF